MPQNNTAKTPIPIFKRLRKVARPEDVTEATQETIVGTTPESKKTTESSQDITPIMNG